MHHLRRLVASLFLAIPALPSQDPPAAPRYWGLRDDRTVTVGYDFATAATPPANIRPANLLPTWHDQRQTGVSTSNLTWMANVGGRTGAWGLTGPGSAKLLLRLDNRPAGTLRKSFWVSWESYGSPTPIYPMVEVASSGAFLTTTPVVDIVPLGGGWSRSNMEVFLEPCPDWEGVRLSVDVGHGQVFAIDRLEACGHCERGVDFALNFRTPRTRQQEELIRRAARMWAESLDPPGADLQVTLNISIRRTLPDNLAGQTTGYAERNGLPSQADIALLDSLHFSVNSCPAGLVDGLTVVLHEMGHALGLYDGATGLLTQTRGEGHRTVLYDRGITNGSDVVAFLIRERSRLEHLDGDAHPDALMRPVHPPGQRTTISPLDKKVLSVIKGYVPKGASTPVDARLGDSCLPNGSRLLVDRLPLEGTTFGLLHHGASTPTPGFAVLGFSCTTFQGTPLPMSLDPVGSPCELLVSAHLTHGFVTDANGQHLLTVTVPNGVGFGGARLYGQNLLLHPSTGIETTNAVQMQVARTTWLHADGFDASTPRVDLTSNNPVSLPGGWTAFRDAAGQHAGTPAWVETQAGRLHYRGGQGFGSDTLFVQRPLPSMPPQWVLRMRVSAEGSCTTRGQLHLRDLADGPFRVDLGPTGWNLNGVDVAAGALPADVEHWVEIVNGQSFAELRVWPLGTHRPTAPAILSGAVGALDGLRFVGGNSCAPAIHVDWLQIYSD